MFTIVMCVLMVEGMSVLDCSTLSSIFSLELD